MDIAGGRTPPKSRQRAPVDREKKKGIPSGNKNVDFFRRARKDEGHSYAR